MITSVYDSLDATISSQAIDLIYSLACRTLKIKPAKKRAKDSLPQPPEYFDGDGAKIILDLGFRGDRFISELKYVESRNDRDFLRLLNYLKQTTQRR